MVGFGECRIEAGCSPIFRDGFIQASQISKGIALVQAKERRLRPDMDRFGEQIDRLGVIPLLLHRQAEKIERIGLIGLKAQNLAISGSSLFQSTCAMVGERLIK